MTLIVYIEIPIIDPYAPVQIYLGTTFQRHTLLEYTDHTWIFQWLHALYIIDIAKSGFDMLKDKNTHVLT